MRKSTLITFHNFDNNWGFWAVEEVDTDFTGLKAF